MYFLEKYDELSESVAFGQKLMYFADQNVPKVNDMKMNFEYFQIQIQKRMLQRVERKK